MIMIVTTTVVWPVLMETLSSSGVNRTTSVRRLPKSQLRENRVTAPSKTPLARPQSRGTAAVGQPYARMRRAVRPRVRQLARRQGARHGRSRPTGRRHRRERVRGRRQRVLVTARVARHWAAATP